MKCHNPAYHLLSRTVLVLFLLLSGAQSIITAGADSWDLSQSYEIEQLDQVRVLADQLHPTFSGDLFSGLSNCFSASFFTFSFANFLQQKNREIRTQFTQQVLRTSTYQTAALFRTLRRLPSTSFSPEALL